MALSASFKFVGSTKAPKWTAIYDTMVEALEKQTGPMLQDYHERVVAPWSGEKPGWVQEVVHGAGFVAVHVKPTGGKGRAKWLWLRGTEPHIIRPKRAKVLRFPTIYMPRTRPGAGGQYQGPGKATGPIATAQVVHHPGTEPRMLPRAIARWSKPFFIKQMRGAIKRGKAKV